MDDILRPLLIVALVVTEVALWQWRVVVAARGNRVHAMALGGIGAVLQITAISQVVTNLRDPLSIAAYAAGVALGVLFGLVAGDRFTPGTVGVRIVTASPAVAARLRARGWAVTGLPGLGEGGPVDVLSVAISRRHAARLRRDVADLAPDAFVTTTDLSGDPPPPAPVGSPALSYQP